MSRTYRRASWALALAVSVILVACASDGEDGGGDLAVFEEALNTAKAAVESKRVELAAVNEEIANAGEDTAEEALAEMEARRDALAEDVTALADDVNAKATELINKAGLVAGEEPQGAVRDAILTKQHEDMLVAQEYIDKGGDYARAIQILEQTADLPVDNPDLTAALEQAKADQYMDQERFSQVRVGMSGDEVKQLLGTVNPHNRREYPDRDVEAWFYRKEEGIAGVYFEQQADGLRVYRTEFEVSSE